MMRDIASAPHTSTMPARPLSTRAAASSSAYVNPAQAALRSSAAGRRRAAEQLGDRRREPGHDPVRVVVATMMRSTSAASRLASARAVAQASAASGASASPGSSQ